MSVDSAAVAAEPPNAPRQQIPPCRRSQPLLRGSVGCVLPRSKATVGERLGLRGPLS